jgi:hypothetical protein
MHLARGTGGSGSGRRRLATAAGVAALVVSGITVVPSAAQAGSCRQIQAVDEPPCNPALPDSPWNVSHRNSYAQASSPFPGLEGPEVRFTHVDLPGIPVAMQFTGRYGDGHRALWGSLVSNQGEGSLFKADARTGELIDLYVPAEREPSLPKPQSGGITGSYNILDRDNHFIVPRQREIEVYGDAKQGRLRSRIDLIKRYRLPDSALCRPEDRIVGATMTFDGYVAFATEMGVTGTIPRQPKRMRNSNLRTVSFNGSKCGDASVPAEQLEEVSNSIAADENGGIYVVTSKRMRRVDHDSDKNTLRSTWKARYNAGSSQSAIRLGVGSGSTPTVMGTGNQDEFVVITDGQDLMHNDLFWRNRIPKDWKGMSGDRPRRMACEYPVRFGDPQATQSLSEQSVTVRGYATFHVNNLLHADIPATLPPTLRNALAALTGGDPNAAPHGAERIDWNPKTRKCRQVWANSRVSIPNSIPSMSSASGLAYGVGQTNGLWGVQALDWRTGRLRFFARATPHSCSPQVIEWLKASGIYGAAGPVLTALPNSCENSFYAATEIGPGGAIYTGTFMGLSIYRPRSPGAGS